jgi:hypothetical protein
MRKVLAKLGLAFSLLVPVSFGFAGTALAAGPGCSGAYYLYQSDSHHLANYAQVYCQTTSQQSVAISMHLRRCSWKIGSYCASWDEVDSWSRTCSGHVNSCAAGWYYHYINSSDTWAGQVWYYWDGAYQGAASSPAIET